MRRLAFVVLTLGLLGLAIYPFLDPGTPERRPPASRPDYSWGNKLVLTQPPHSAYAPAVFDDPIERAIHRLEWGKTDLVRWTQNHLPGPEEQMVRRLCERVQEVAAGTPLSARRLLETLGVLGSATAIPTLLEFAQKDPDYLQLAAIQALTHCPLTEEASDVLIRLSGSANTQVKSAANRAVWGREDVWDEATIIAFLEGNEDESVNLLLSEVGKRQMGFAADAAARHLDSDQVRTRQLAIAALLALRDPRGIAAGEAELRLSDAGRIVPMLTAYRDARLLPPLDLARSLAEHPDTTLQTILAQSLRPTLDEDDGADAIVVQILEQLSDTPDEATRRASIASLYRRGHHRHLQPYRQDLDRAYGAALKDAVKFLCEQLQDPRAAIRVRERLDQPLEPLDRVNLLFGLRFVGSQEDTDRFLDWIVIGGSPEDRVASEQTYVSEFAGLYLQDLPGVVAGRVIARFPEANTTWAQLGLLDSLRGLATGTPEEIEFVCSLIEDSTRPPEVQMAAAETLPYVWTPELGERVLALAREAATQELGAHLQLIYACYF